jgi:hypothetical protein
MVSTPHTKLANFLASSFSETCDGTSEVLVVQSCIDLHTEGCVKEGERNGAEEKRNNKI